MSIGDMINLINKIEADGILERYAIGGAVGATFYLEPVATLDINIFITFRMKPGEKLVSLKPIFDYIISRGGIIEGEYIVVSGWPVQFLPAEGSLAEEALAEAMIVDVRGIPARVFTAEHLAAIALQTGRAKDKARLMQFIEAGALNTNRFEVIIAKHDLVNRWQEFERNFLKGE